MRIIYLSALAIVALAAVLYFAFDELLEGPGTPLHEVEERLAGSGFEELAPMLRPSAELESIDDLTQILRPEDAFDFADGRSRGVRLPAEALAAIRGGEREFYPIEVAALAVAALRSRAHGGRPASVMEVTALEGVPSPDPGGRLGYYVVDVEGERFDPFGGHTDLGDAQGRVLSDVEAVAAAGAVAALVSATRGGDVSKALRMAARAHELDPRSPSIRAIEGTLLMIAGQSEEGAHELEAALSLSPDPARKNVVAGLRFAMGDLASASKLVEEALAADPRLAPGLVTRATLELARGDLGGARASLREAERIDPRLPSLPVLFAQLDLSEGDASSAKRRIEDAIERHPDDPQTHMAAIQVFHAASDYDAMRRSVQAVLRSSPPAQRPMLEEQIRAAFGPSALLQPLELEELDEGDLEADLELEIDPALSAGADGFKLKEPTLERTSGFRLELGD